MKTLGYFQALRGWQMDNGQILSMPPDAKAEHVVAEGDRLKKITDDAAIEAAKPKPLPDLAGELIATIDQLLVAGAPAVWVKGGMKKVTDYLKTKGIE